jgi:hypothetical protein
LMALTISTILMQLFSECIWTTEEMQLADCQNPFAHRGTAWKSKKSSMAFPQISRQIMMSKLNWSHANATYEICRRV